MKKQDVFDDKTGCQVRGRDAAGICVRKNKILICVLFCDDIINSNFPASNVKMIHERTLGEELVQMLLWRNRGTSPYVAWS